MTQDERWITRYEEVKTFIETNKRNPSKYRDEEKLMVHFLKRGRKDARGQVSGMRESGGQEL